MEPLLLASASPQRAALLQQAGLPFHAVAPEIDETVDLEQQIDDRVRQLAERKVRATLPHATGYRWVVGCDTLVHISGRIMGKPASREEAMEMLASLAGKTHRVHTGVAVHSLLQDQITVKSAITEVRFRPLTQGEITRYVDTSEWRGAAGAYRIQKCGETLIEGINGSYSNVVGLPLSLLCGMLSDSRYPFQ